MRKARALVSKHWFLIKMIGYALLTGLSCWWFWDNPVVIVAVPAFLVEFLVVFFCVRSLFRLRRLRSKPG